MALLYGKFARPSPTARTPVGTSAVKGAVIGDGVSIVVSSSGVASAPSGSSAINQLTGDVLAGPGSGPQVATVVKVNSASVPLSKAFVGTNGSGQIVAAATAPVTWAPPYSTDGTNFYDPDGFQVTKPPSAGSLVWIGTAPTTVTTAANGNLKIATGGTANPGFQSQSASSSAEVIVRVALTSTSASQTDVGCWLWDSTNNLIYSFSQTTSGSGPLAVRSWTYNGSGTPSISTTFVSPTFPYAPYAHLRLLVSGGVILAQVCLDGQTYDTVYTTGAVGTITKGGLIVMDSGLNLIASVIHEKVQ